MKGTLRMYVVRGSWRMWGALVVMLTICDQAHAFYWYGWPGSRLRVEPTIIGPPQQVPPAVQPPGRPPFQPPPGPPIKLPTEPGGPSVPVDKTPIGPPEHTPEPSTGLIGLLGLGALAAARRWRSKK